jgi:hypothetical protein
VSNKLIKFFVGVFLLGVNCTVMQFAVNYFVPLNGVLNDCLDSEFYRSEPKGETLAYSTQRECWQGSSRRYDVVIKRGSSEVRVARVLDGTNTRLTHRLDGEKSLDIFVDGGGRVVECGNGVNEMAVRCYVDGELQPNNTFSGTFKFFLLSLLLIVFQMYLVFRFRRRIR